MDGAGGSCSAQRCLAPLAAGPTGNAGCGPRRKLPCTMRPSLIDFGPIGTLSGLRELRAGASAKPEQAPQGATGRGLGRSCGPQVDWKSGYWNRSRGRRNGGVTVIFD
jgi:hypothetical protein